MVQRAADSASTTASVSSRRPRKRHDFLLPEGHYDGMAAWWGPENWLAIVAQILATPEGDATRKAVGPSASTVLEVAQDEATHADYATGRNLETSNGSVAKRLGVSVDTVRLARRVLVRLGLSVTVRKGRHTNETMRKESLEYVGRTVYRIASTRALLIPAGVALEEAAVAAPAPAEKPKRKPRPARKPIAKHLLRLAAELTAGSAAAAEDPKRPSPALRNQNLGLRHLDVQGSHIGNVALALDVVPDPENWTGPRLKALVDAYRTTFGFTALSTEARNGLGLLRSTVSRALGAVEAGLLAAPGAIPFQPQATAPTAVQQVEAWDAERAAPEVARSYRDAIHAQLRASRELELAA